MIKNTLIVLFAAWISFVPEPVQQHYWVWVRVFLCVVLLALIMARKPSEKTVFNRADWPLWVFLLGIGPGIANAGDKGLALKTYFYLSLTFLPVFYIGKALARCRRLLVAFITAIVSCSIFVSVLGIFETIFRYNPLYTPLIDNPYYLRNISEVIARPMSTLYNPIPLATYLACMLPLGIFLARDDNKARRLVGSCAVVLNSICLGLTFSRASLAGVALMCLCYFLLKRKYRSALVLAVTLLAVLAALSFVPYPFSRFSVQGIGFYSGGIADGGRIIRMQMSWAMFKTHPFFGVGLSQYRVLFDQFYPFKAQLEFLLHEVKIPENMYCALLAETGLAGAAGFAALVVFLAGRAAGKLKQAADAQGKRVLLLFICLFAGIMVSMTGYELLYWFTPCVLFCLASGFLAGAEYS